MEAEAGVPVNIASGTGFQPVAVGPASLPVPRWVGRLGSLPDCDRQGCLSHYLRPAMKRAAAPPSASTSTGTAKAASIIAESTAVWP